MKKNNGLKIAILSLSFLLMTRLTISPALAEIGRAFPSQNEGSLMNMVVLASALSIPFGLISGYLTRFMNKKPLLIIGLILYLVGGLGPIFVNSYSIILGLRAVLGAGIGFILPMTTGLIADYFVGDERINMFGFQNSSVAVGNIVTSLLAGVFAAISWRYSFLIYAVGIIALVLTLWKIPEPPKAEIVSGKRKPVNKRVLFICLSMFVYAIIYFSFFGYLSFVIENHHLGNATTTGVATMLMTAASLIMGFVFRALTMALRKFNVFVALGINFVGFLLLSMASSAGIVFIGAIIIGCGFGFIMPTSIMKVTEASDKSEATFSNGLLMTFLNIGTAVSPTLLQAIGNRFNNTDGKFIYLICSIGLAIATIIAFANAIITKENDSESVIVG